MKLSNELKIGILVVATVAALLALTFRVGNFNFAQKGYFITVHFFRLEGIEKNAPVRLNGLEVGSVKEIHVIYEPETVMELKVWLDDKAKLRQGAQALIKNMGLLGEKYVELTGGDKGMPFLPPETLIVGQEPPDFEKLLAKADTIADSLKSISANVDERLRVNSQAIDEIFANMTSTTNNLEEFSADLKIHPWKLLYREKKPTEKK